MNFTSVMAGVPLRITLHAEEAGQIVKDHCYDNIEHNVQTLDELPEGYDLYIDCTGFRKQFVLDKTPAPISDLHHVDSAWVCPFQMRIYLIHEALLGITAGSLK